jgi:aryl-alcohol dehydrogenase-like predicted oxidoreductase
MHSRRLGTSPLEAPVVAFGAWAIGGWAWGGADDAQAIAALRAGIDAGIRAIDTAPMYGFGHSEVVVGRALAGHPSPAQVWTKVGLRWDDDRGAHFFDTTGPDGAPRTVHRNLRPDSVRLEVERSLERLGRPALDLVQCHWPDPSTPVEETMAALAQLHEEGLVGAIGVSNFSPELLERSRRALAERGLPLASTQPRYSLLDRAIEADVLPWCRDHRVGVVAYSPLAQGLLTGTITLDRTFPDGDLRGTRPGFDRERRRRVLDALDQAGDIAAAHDATLAQLAIAWVVAQPGVTAAIVGARTPSQARENAAAGELTLSGAEARTLGGLLAAVDAD